MESITEKVCKQCGQRKYIGDFYKNTGGWVYGKCKVCIVKNSKKWNIENKEKRRENTIKWYKSNPDKKRVYDLDYSKKHPEKKREKERRWRATNSERRKETARKWKQKNPEKLTEYRHRRRTLALGNGGSFTALEWKNLKEKYGNRCLCCGKQNKLTADHVIPVSMGGTSNIDNIQPLCKTCNSSKGTKIIDYRS